MKPLTIRPRASPETFMLESVVSVPEEDVCRCSALHSRRIANRLLEVNNTDDLDLWYATAAIHEKEKINRNSIIRKNAAKSRNINLDVGQGVPESVYGLLRTANKAGKVFDVDYENLKKNLTEVFAPACELLGLVGGKDNLMTVRVTDEVVAATANIQLQSKLRYWLTQGDLFSQQVSKVQFLLEQEFPDQAQPVMAALKKTESQKHLSAISLDVHEGQTWVSLVNDDGDHMKLEGYKFLGLLENPSTGRLLHKFEIRKWQSSNELFVFKDYREGRVSGRFLPEQCKVEVAHILDKGDRVNVRSWFYLEKEYLACLFVVLKRLREDREWVARLLEDADATETFDPFEAIIN